MKTTNIFIKQRRPLFFLIIFMMFLFLVSCSSTNQKLLKVPPTFFNPYFPEKVTVIEPGDELTIRFYYHPELDEKVKVRPDGKISLLFYQGLKVDGLTPEQLQKKIVEIYSREFRNPLVSVNIEKTESNFVFVSGEILDGGTKKLSKNMTVGQLLALCRVNYRTASLEDIVLVRRIKPTEYRAYKINASVNSGAERDIYLKPGDMIFVPRNGITKLGDFVQQYIRNLIPPNMNLGLGFTYELHSESEY